MYILLLFNLYRVNVPTWMYTVWSIAYPWWFIPHMLHAWFPGPSHRRLRASGHWHWRQATEITVVSNGWIQKKSYRSWFLYGFDMVLRKTMCNSRGFVDRAWKTLWHHVNPCSSHSLHGRVIPITQFSLPSDYFCWVGAGAKNDSNDSNLGHVLLFTIKWLKKLGHCT